MAQVIGEVIVSWLRVRSSGSKDGVLARSWGVSIADIVGGLFSGWVVFSIFLLL